MLAIAGRSDSFPFIVVVDENSSMKTKLSACLLACLLAPFLQGCIAFPPLIQVEHKDTPNNNQEVIKRLDAIDRRLDKLEQTKPTT